MHTAEAHDLQIRRWVLLAIVIAFGLRVWGLDIQSIWRDEADSLAFASSPALLAQMFTTPGHNAPLYYLLLRGWTGVAGAGIVSARLFSALWGTLAVALTYAVGRRLFSSPLGALAAFCAALSPYLVWYSQEARTYAPLLALSLLSFWLYLRALERGRPADWIAYALVTAVCLYLHVMAALLVLAQALAGVWWCARGRRAWRGAALALAGVALLGLPLLAWEARFLLAPLTPGQAPASPGQIAAGLLLALTTTPTGRLPLALAAPGLFVALAGALLPNTARSLGLRSGASSDAERATPSRPSASEDADSAGVAASPTAVVLIWLLLPPAALILISLIVPLYTERYLIFIAPAFYLLLARGLLALRAAWKPLALLAGGALIAIAGAGLWVQATQPIKPDFRAAVAGYVAGRQPGDRVLFLIPQAQVVFEQLAPAGASSPYLAAPFANDATNRAHLDRNMKRLVGEGQRIWLVESEAGLWDSQGLVARWLADHGRPHVSRFTFHLLTLTLYEGVSSHLDAPSWPLDSYLPLVYAHKGAPTLTGE